MLQLKLLFLCSFLSVSLIGQNSLSGRVLNELNDPLIGATAVLLETKDSTIIAFSITDGDGRFQFVDLEDSKCILQISYVSYSNYSEVVNVGTLKDSEKLINLIPSNEVLKEVTLKAEHIPMGILGDTINYNAAAFKTKVGDTVEDLLKKMPGIEVARDGSIKAQGEDVENVLVDGREFFGSDPTVATKNLEAEAIDKVQVYDKQSDIAEFTGIDDGQEEKTINLKLKEEYKNGGFGRVELGLANEERWKTKLNYNRFSPTYQASILGAANNINEQAFSFNEYVNFMGGLSQAMSMSSGAYNFGNFGTPVIPEGLNLDYSGGVNFNIDINDKLNFRSNYFYLSTRKDLSKTISSLQLRDQGSFSTKDTLILDNGVTNHRINTRLEYKLNAFTELVLKADLLSISNDEDERSNSTFRIMDDVLSDNITNWVNDKAEYGLNLALQFRRKFLKKGRSFISTSTFNMRNTDGVNDIVNAYVIGQNPIETLQHQTILGDQSSGSLSSAYTEPLGKQYFLSVDANYQNEVENADKSFFDLENGIEQINNNLSMEFEKEYTHLDFGISLKRNRRNFKTSLSLDRKYLTIDLHSLKDEFILNRDFSYYMPAFNAETEIGRNTTFNFNYNTEVLLPTMSQLMPVVDNRQATITTVGSPNLTPEYRHDLGLNINYFDNFNFTNLFFNIGHSIIKDRVVNKIDLDDDLNKVITPINSTKFNTSFAFLSFSRPIRSLKTKFRLSSQVSRNSYESFLNQQSSEVDELNLVSRIVLENIKKDKIDVAVGLALDFTDRNYSLNDAFSQSFSNHSIFVDLVYSVSETFTISSNFDLTNYSSEFFAEETSFKLWNASISKLMFDKRLEFKLSAFDLLGQNIGLKRSGGLSALTESKFNTLQSYFMVSIGYRLGQKKKKNVLDI